MREITLLLEDDDLCAALEAAAEKHRKIISFL